MIRSHVRGLLIFWIILNASADIIYEWMKHTDKVEGKWQNLYKDLWMFIDNICSVYFLLLSVHLLNGLFCGRIFDEDGIASAIAFSAIYFFVGVVRYFSEFKEKSFSVYANVTRLSTGYVDADGVEIYPDDKYSYCGRVGWIEEHKRGHYYFCLPGDFNKDRYPLSEVASKLKIPKQKNDQTKNVC